MSKPRDDDIDSWYVGLEWSDVFIEGNSFGVQSVLLPTRRW